jgi:hypothetical protein
MNKFVNKNTPLPTTAIYTEEVIKSFKIPGLLEGASAEIISAYGFDLLPAESNTKVNDTDVLIADKDNNEWTVRWVSIDEWNTIEQNRTLILAVRSQRDRLLSQTDWTQHSDVNPSVRAAWQPYRAELRHITKQEGFPTTIVWPTAPTEFPEVVKENTNGKDGKDGVDGRDGRDGKDGAVGPQGPQGIQGPMGPAGKDGLPGAQGPKGDTGAQGIQGLPGKDGKDGVSITSAVVNSTGNLIITKSDGTTVDAGKVSSTATTTTAGGPPVVGSAPNPFAPIIVTAPPGYKAANLDDGVELTLDTLAVMLPTSGARSLQMRVTTGTMNVRISGEIYWCNGNWVGNYGANYWTGTALNTTYQQIFSWNFPWEGDKATYHIIDQTNRRLYRVTLIIGAGYKKNFIIMERLV